MTRLKLLRIKSGVSQQCIANFLGITRQAYCNYELGKREADYKTLLALSKYFQTTVDLILGKGELVMFSERLRELRNEKGISQKELAIALFVSQQTVAKWETDRSTPNPDMISQIAQYFDVSSDYLIGNSDSKSAMINAPTDDDIKFALFDGAKGISDEAYEEVKRFAAFIKEKYQKD